VLAGRKALAWARTRAGDWIVGTRDELVLPVAGLRWETILAADWDAEDDTLTVVGADATYIVELESSALLLQLVRERVTASIVLTRRVTTDGRLGFTAMARRPPSGGEITFTYEYDPGVDPDDPGVLKSARATLRDLRHELGL
jgi:hypothetical protein